MIDAATACKPACRVDLVLDMHLKASHSQLHISHRGRRNTCVRPRWHQPRVSFAVELEVERTMLRAKEASGSLVPQDRPCFHLAPKQGWLNDPNVRFYCHRWFLAPQTALRRVC